MTSITATRLTNFGHRPGFPVHSARKWPSTRVSTGRRGKPGDNQHRRIERRRTLPVDRGTWRFDTLDELVLAPDPVTDTSQEES